LSNAGILHLQTNNHLNAEKFVPKTIFESPLKQYEQPIVIGFPGLQQNQLRQAVIPVFFPNATECDINFSTAFCTTLRISEVATCGGFFGAGMFDRSTEPIRGIIIRDGFCATADRFEGNFHDVTHYREWILKASSTGAAMKINFVLFVFTIFRRFF
jgi:hypothetical protein